MLFFLNYDTELPMPSTAGETKDLGREHALRRQDAPQKTMARNRKWQLTLSTIFLLSLHCYNQTLCSVMCSRILSL